MFRYSVDNGDNVLLSPNTVKMKVSVTGWNNQDGKFVQTITDKDGNVLHEANTYRPVGDYKTFDTITGEEAGVDGKAANTTVDKTDTPYTGDNIPDFADIDNDNDAIFNPIEVNSELGLYNKVQNTVNMEHNL